MEFLQSILEIPHTSLPVDSPSTELSLNEIEQWLCTERLYCLIDIQTRSVVILGLSLCLTQALIQQTLCTDTHVSLTTTGVIYRETKKSMHFPRLLTFITTWPNFLNSFLFLLMHENRSHQTPNLKFKSPKLSLISAKSPPQIPLGKLTALSQTARLSGATTR